MDVHGLLGLNDPIGFLICLTGFSAQVWLARKNKWMLTASVVLAVILFLLFEAISENWLGRGRALFGHTADAWLQALTEVWCISVSVICAAVTVRDRLPAFHRNHGIDRSPVFDQSRRDLFLVSNAVICAAPAAVFAFGILKRKDFDIREIDLKLPGLPHDLRNVRLVQVSDIHLGAFYSEQDLIRVIDAANGLRADVAIMTGDLITSGNDPLAAGLKQLSRLKAPAGIWGCLGNHEHFAGVENKATELGAALGVNFLRWQSKNLRFGQSTLNLVGVDYQPMRSPYLTGTEELVEPGMLNVLLSHNPDVFPVATAKGFDAVLAGHTHGGQINVEILDKNLNIADFVTPYTKGLYTDAASAIYVNSGIGTIGMPVRLGAAPEITLIKLCAS